ncbi:MAG TPA: stage II sporulation protein M [Flavisolibacter sp.]|nr:stage II sporulation protein M [Flavisolibacter sp.]
MREGLFIKKNKDRWERVQAETSQDADEVAKDFVQLVDDLAYAKTFYPTSRVTHYINSMASKIYLNIYKNRKEESNRLLNFWKYDVPLTVKKHHPLILVAFIIFMLFFSVGFFSAANEPGFVREVLGDGYVDMTENNIEKGNPFGVYQDTNSFVMFIRIMVNNILVSFIYFFRGILLGIPSLVALGKESIRLGAFEHMFYIKGLGGQAVTTVLIHGLLELTAIIIACGAGVVMGISFLFPGTRRRLDAFREGTKDGIKMIIGLVPVFIVAAFYEGFVTRYYKMPLPLNLLILLSSAVFITWYFVIYPGVLKKRLNEARENDV